MLTKSKSDLIDAVFSRALRADRADPRYARFHELVWALNGLIKARKYTRDELIAAVDRLQAEVEALDARSSVILPFKPSSRA